MPFSTTVKARAMVACGRCCCICHRFRGLKLESHHIKPEAKGGPNTFDNCIPICFDCHSDQVYDQQHPRGTKYSEAELRMHRDRWYAKVANSPAARYDAQHLKTDRRTYGVLTALLPWKGSISFIRTNNFAGFSFELDRLDDLFDFEDRCTDPGFEFIDADLEALRAELNASTPPRQSP